MWRLGNPVSFLLSVSHEPIPVTNIQCRVLLLHREIESFASISQVMWLLVICVLNLKLRTPGYGWLIPESAGKEHSRWFLASEAVASMGLRGGSSSACCNPRKFSLGTARRIWVVFRQGDFGKRWEGAVPGGTSRALPTRQQILVLSLQSCCGFSTQLFETHFTVFTGFITGAWAGEGEIKFFLSPSTFWTFTFIFRVVYVQLFWLDPSCHFSATAHIP